MIKRDSQNHKPSLIFTDFIDGFEKTKRLCALYNRDTEKNHQSHFQMNQITSVSLSLCVEKIMQKTRNQ